jgi:hypothetical protein
MSFSHAEMSFGERTSCTRLCGCLHTFDEGNSLIELESLPRAMVRKTGEARLDELDAARIQHAVIRRHADDDGPSTVIVNTCSRGGLSHSSRCP